MQTVYQKEMDHISKILLTNQIKKQLRLKRLTDLGNICVTRVLIFLSLKVKVTQLCPTLCNLTVHGILHSRVLERVIFPFSRGSSQCRNQIQDSCTAGGFFPHNVPAINMDLERILISRLLQIKEKNDPAIPLLGIHTEETRIEGDTCTPMEAT